MAEDIDGHLSAEKITEAFEHEIKEAAHWLGGWDALRKVIDQLEDNADEAAFERYFDPEKQ